MTDRVNYTQSIACSLRRSSWSIDEHSRFEVLCSITETFLTIHILIANYIYNANGSTIAQLFTYATLAYFYHLVLEMRFIFLNIQWNSDIGLLLSTRVNSQNYICTNCITFWQQGFYLLPHTIKVSMLYYLSFRFYTVQLISRILRAWSGW